MKLKWLGHSCFLITSETGLRIITDPYPQGSGLSYPPIKDAADVVTLSHDHFDHNNVSGVPGRPEIASGSGTNTVKGIEFKGIPTYHDESRGKNRGTNTIFCFTVDKLRLCHLGDLGHRLAEDQIAEIGTVDILFIPVGGFYTIDAKTASLVSEDLKPRVAVPMHYKTARCDFPITGVDDFIKGKVNVKKLDSSEAEFKANSLPEPAQILVFRLA